MKKLLGILVLGLLWCNIAASEEILLDPREAEATYGCKLEDGNDEKQRIIYLVKQLTNDNFLVNFWAPRSGYFSIKMPTYPDNAYKNKGWKDFLGTG